MNYKPWWRLGRLYWPCRIFLLEKYFSYGDYRILRSKSNETKIGLAPYKSNAFKKEQLQIPLFEQVRGGVLATIQREVFVALNKQNGSNIVGDSGDVSVTELTERQRKIIDLIRMNPTITVTQMSVIMSVIKRTIERELAILKKEGVIAREGSARFGRWIILKP